MTTYTHQCTERAYRSSSHVWEDHYEFIFHAKNDIIELSRRLERAIGALRAFHPADPDERRAIQFIIAELEGPRGFSALDNKDL